MKRVDHALAGRAPGRSLAGPRPLGGPAAVLRARGAAIRQCGFTLVEVLVAVAIVALALGAGLKAAGALTSNAQRFTDVSAAQWCADNQLAGLRLSRQFPGIGDIEFACEQLGRNYQGVLAVRPTPNPNFRRVDARVADENGDPVLTLSTVLSRY